MSKKKTGWIARLLFLAYLPNWLLNLRWHSRQRTGLSGDGSNGSFVILAPQSAQAQSPSTIFLSENLSPELNF
jgi:hypothetical protein